MPKAAPGLTLLRRICRQLQSDRSWSQLAGRTPSQSANWIWGNSRHLNACPPGRRCAICSPGGDWWGLTLMLDLERLQFADLTLMCLHSHADIPLLYPEMKRSKPTPEFVLGSLAASVASGIAAYRRLTCLGFEGPAKVLGRWTLELADGLTAIVADPAAYHAYVSAPTDFEAHYRHWRKHLSPKKLRAYLTSPADEGDSVLDEIVKWSESTYQWLSGYSHLSFMGQSLSVWLPVLGEPDTNRPALLPFQTEASRPTMASVAGHLAVCSMRLLHDLAIDHGWHGLRNDKSRGEWVFRAQVLTRLFIDEYDSLRAQSRVPRQPPPAAV